MSDHHHEFETRIELYGVATNRRSPGLITFGIINLVVALMPPCAGFGGCVWFVDNPHLEIQNREVGPEFAAKLEDRAPHARYEAIVILLFGTLLSILLFASGIGLILSQQWARWLTIGTVFFFVLTFCTHDVYQFAFVRPVVDEFIDGQMLPGPEREGFRVGFQTSFFLWSCFNPVVIIYLTAMCVYLLLTNDFSDRVYDEPRRRDDRRSNDESPRRRRYDDNDDDDDYQDRITSR